MMKNEIYRISREAAQQMALAGVDLGQVALALRLGQTTQQAEGVTRYALAGVWVTAQAKRIIAVGRGGATTRPKPE